MNYARQLAIIIIALTASAILAVALLRLSDSRRHHIDVSRDTYPIVGIDISAHNGHVDFDSVASSGISFVFLKATEGTTFRDSKFKSNYDAARKAGLKVGAYHFFRFDSDGYLQGRNFLDAIDSLYTDLPLAIDIEEANNPDNITTDNIIESLRGMIITLESSGRKVIIYTNKRGLSRFIRRRLDEMPVWVCSFTDPPIPSDDWVLWQHSHESHIDGVKGSVDLNTFNGDSLCWVRWLEDMNSPGQ